MKSHVKYSMIYRVGDIVVNQNNICKITSVSYNRLACGYIVSFCTIDNKSYWLVEPDFRLANKEEKELWAILNL